jgi:hypothetical protein
VEILDAARRDRTGGYRVDVSRGERIRRVSSEWFSRPADERYLSLSGLVAAVQRIAGNGTGDTRRTVPGVLDWSTGIYSPRVDITKDTTTSKAPAPMAWPARRAMATTMALR